MKLLSYLFGLKRYYGRLCVRGKAFFIIGTIFNIIGSALIFFLLLLGFACFGINTSFSSLGDTIVGGLGSGILMAVGIIVLLGVVVTVIRNIPSQIMVAVVGFRRYKEDGITYLICGIISILSFIALIVLIILQFVGL